MTNSGPAVPTACSYRRDYHPSWAMVPTQLLHYLSRYAGRDWNYSPTSWLQNSQPFTECTISPWLLEDITESASSFPGLKSAQFSYQGSAFQHQTLASLGILGTDVVSHLVLPSPITQWPMDKGLVPSLVLLGNSRNFKRWSHWSSF